MAKTKVEVELSAHQEIALADRYGRGCSRETLIDRAIAEAVSLKAPWVKPVRVKRGGVSSDSANSGPTLPIIDEDVATALFMFSSGSKLFDGEGREIASIQASDTGQECLVQFFGDDADWTLIKTGEIKYGEGAGNGTA